MVLHVIRLRGTDLTDCEMALGARPTFSRLSSDSKDHRTGTKPMSTSGRRLPRPVPIGLERDELSIHKIGCNATCVYFSSVESDADFGRSQRVPVIAQLFRLASLKSLPVVLVP